MQGMSRTENKKEKKSLPMKMVEFSLMSEHYDENETTICSILHEFAAFPLTEHCKSSGV